jgi:acetylornithine deacetylase
MIIDVIRLAKNLISYNSASYLDNSGIADYSARKLKEVGFAVEKVTYKDKNGTTKVSVVAKKGKGRGGLGLLAHTDTVPAEGWRYSPFKAFTKEGKLYGRGSCDMKGPIASMMVAGAKYKGRDLKSPLYIILTSDEETDCGGAKAVMKASRLFREGKPLYGVICEPTQMEVIHAHKGVVHIRAFSKGVAAHSSTGKGLNANLKMIPFLGEMKKMYETLTTNRKYFNADFDPPFTDWNVNLSNGDTPPNVTVPLSVCTINFRPMPGLDTDAIIGQVKKHGRRFGLQVKVDKIGGSLFTPLGSEIVQSALEVTGQRRAKTVPYGTDGLAFSGSRMEMVILGPGNIRQAHTVGEWVKVNQLHRAIEVYGRLIERFCL